MKNSFLIYIICNLLYFLSNVLILLFSIHKNNVNNLFILLSLSVYDHCNLDIALKKHIFCVRLFNICHYYDSISEIYINVDYIKLFTIYSLSFKF